MDLYKNEKRVINNFFELRALPYRVGRITLTPKYACYSLSVTAGKSMRDINKHQSDMARVIYNNRNKAGYSDTVKVIINDQPAMVVVARVDSKTLLYKDRPKAPKPRYALVGRGFQGDKGEDIFLDLNDADTFSVLAGGRSGCGKSSILRQMTLTACEISSPEELQVAIIDIGAKALGAFKMLPHCCAYVTTLEESMALLSHYRDSLVGSEDNYQTRTIILIDESTELFATGDKAKDEAFSLAIEKLAQRGRGYGISLFLGAQNPTQDNLPVSARRSIPVRIAGMCPEDAMSEIILGVGHRDAEKLSMKGTFIIRYAGVKRMVFSYLMSEEEIINGIASLARQYDKCEQVKLLVADEEDPLPNHAVEAAITELRKYDNGDGTLRSGYITPTKKAIADAIGLKSTEGTAREKFNRYLQIVLEMYKSNNYLL